MRIILLLAAAAGAAAIGTAAPARPAGKFTGPGAGSPWASAPAGGHRARTGWQGRSRPGMGRDHDRRDGGHGGRHGLRFYDGVGIAGPTGIVAPYGNGFFAGGGGEVRMRGGRPYYDYDRSYPYEWASAARAPREQADEARSAEPPHCTVEYGIRICRGW